MFSEFVPTADKHPFSFENARIKISDLCADRYRRTVVGGLQLLDAGSGTASIAALAPSLGNWISADAKKIDGTFQADMRQQNSFSEEQFDIITGVALLHYQDAANQEKVIQNIRGWLREDGDIFLYALTPKHNEDARGITTLTKKIDEIRGSTRQFEIPPQEELERIFFMNKMCIMQKSEDTFRYTPDLYAARFELQSDLVRALFSEIMQRQEFSLTRTLYCLKPSHNGVIYRTPSSAREFQSYYELRHRILRADLSTETEKDDFEPIAYHLGAWNASTGELIGTARIHIADAQIAVVRKIAVDESYRGAGIGATLLHCLENRVRGMATHIELTVRDNATGFFMHQGYAPIDQPTPALFSYPLFHEVTPMKKKL